MRSIVVVSACLACAGRGRRVQRADEQLLGHPDEESLQSLAEILLAFNPTQSFNLAGTGAVASQRLADLGHRAIQVSMDDSKPEAEGSMKRPALDKGIAKAIEAAEMARVGASLVENEDGSMSEPLEWAEPDSLAQKVSKLSQNGPFAMFKQFIADRLAGDFDEAAVGKELDEDIANNKVLMYSFTTCPFCLKSKQLLESKGVQYKVRELDEETNGNALRAMLGRRTGRTSMPSIWVAGDYLGGANDGGLGGIVTLDGEGKLDPLLKEAGAM